jgi:Icc-related predicted phosphoesterase
MTPTKAGYQSRVQNGQNPDEYLITRLQQAFANDDRMNQLDIEIRMQRDEIILLGSVATEERKSAATAISREMLPGHTIVNELRVIELSEQPLTSQDGHVRIAAVGDVHFGVDSAGQLHRHLTDITDIADILLLAGDLTRHGDPNEAQVLADDLQRCGVPVVAVLGNHDHHSDRHDEIMRVLNNAGIMALEGTSTIVDINGTRVGIAGTKGFGGGFAGACGSEFGERIQKEFIAHSRSLAETLREQLKQLDADIRIALTHFAPVPDTLRGEPLEIYPWLGSHFLAEAIDESHCDWAFHGHAHAGTECGTTPGGVPVRNVAQPVINQPFKVYNVTTHERTLLRNVY